jgi:hypothetical protein
MNITSKLNYNYFGEGFQAANALFTSTGLPGDRLPWIQIIWYTLTNTIKTMFEDRSLLFFKLQLVTTLWYLVLTISFRFM